MRLDDLPIECRDFLKSLRSANEHEAGLALYYRQGGEFNFIEDCKISESENKRFEKESPPKLYRGGVVVHINMPFGHAVVADERYRWFKPVAGLLHFSEGKLRANGAIREVSEEVFAYSLDQKKRFVPDDLLTPRGDGAKRCALGFSVGEIVPFDTVHSLGNEVNERNKAYEAVFVWNLMPSEPFSLHYQEPWFRGGQSGVPFVTLNSLGEVVGLFSGQQGFVSFADYRLHPSLVHEEHLGHA